jgi:hypothetical protein
VLNEVGDDYTLTFTAGALTQTIDIDVAPGTLDSFRLVFVNAAGDVFDLDDDDIDVPTSFQSVDTFEVDTDDTAAVDPGYLALQAVDQFGNEVDVSGETYNISVELLQNGVPAANQNVLIGDDNTGIDPDTLANPYPGGTDAVEIAFDAGFSDGGLFPFSADILGVAVPATIVAGPPVVVNNGAGSGTLFNVSQPGTGYAIQISIGDTVIDLVNGPDVFTTDTFAVEATVDAVNIVEDVDNPSVAGVPLEGVVSGQRLQVEVLDTTGATMANELVQVIVTSCPAGVATGTGLEPTPDGDLTAGDFFCTFAQGDTRGGYFEVGGAVAPSGRRIVTATTNVNGVATFNDLLLSEIGAGYELTFFAGYDPDDPTAAASDSTITFDLEAQDLVSLKVVDNDNIPAAAPTPANVEAEDTIDIDVLDPSGQIVAEDGGAVRVVPLDRYGNILEVVTPITVGAVQPSSNRIFFDNGATLSNAPADRTVDGSFGGALFFAGDLFVSDAGDSGAATGTADPNAGPFRARFSVTGTTITTTTNSVNIP